MVQTISTPTGVNFSKLFSERDRITKDIDKAWKRYHALVERREYDHQVIDIQIKQLTADEEQIRLEMENDPEVLEDMHNGQNPAVIYWGERIEEVMNKQEKLGLDRAATSSREGEALAEIDQLKISLDKVFVNIQKGWETIGK